MSLLVSFEGIEGCGKTTQVELLGRVLSQMGKGVVVTREPGGTAVGQRIRQILIELDAIPLHPMAEVFLCLADRLQHVREVVSPALKAGNIVLSDRFSDSTIAYQGYGRGADVEWITQLNTAACGSLAPHLTFLLDCPAEVGLYRVRQRHPHTGTGEKGNRFEKEDMAFHERVRRGYLHLAQTARDRIVIVDAAQSIQEIHRHIVTLTLARLEEKNVLC